MAIESTAFGPVILSEDDAVQFRDQVAQGPDVRARALTERRRHRTVRYNDSGERVLRNRRTPAQAEQVLGR